MTIHLWNAHDTHATLIEGVTYVEPLPNCIQYTAVTTDGVEEIGVHDGDFTYNGTRFDFLIVY